MQWLLDLLPDWGWRTGFEAFRDLLSLGIAGLGAYLASEAIRLGKQQKQLATDQGRIAAIQGQIVLKQDERLEKELARRAKLEVFLRRESQDPFKWELCVRNRGDRSADQFYWDFLFPQRLNTQIRLEHIRPGENLARPDIKLFGNEPMRWYGDWSIRPAFPGSFAICAVVHFSGALDLQHYPNPIEFRWAVTGENGRFPDATTYGTLRITVTDPNLKEANPDPF